MISSSGKRKKRYLDSLRYSSKLTCMIREIFHYPEQCKVLNYCFTRYASKSTMKEHKRYPIASNKYKKNQDINAIDHHAVDDIVQEGKYTKLSANIEPEQYENVNSELNKKWIV